MDDNIKELKKYVETGTGEGDDAFLKDVFFTSNDYLDVVSLPKSGPRLLKGKKGSGKSAILRYFKKQLESVDVPVLLLRPKDIDFPETSESALGKLTRISEHAILSSIASKIGSGVNGVVVREDDIDLLEMAKREGVVSQDFIEKAFKILAPVGKAVTKIDFSKMGSRGDIGYKRIQRAIEGSLNRSESLFYVLIDDTDQLASPSESNHLNRIWSFLLAARSINESCDNIKFIVSLRDEVWRRLVRDSAGQRDQVDHFRTLSKTISVSNNQIKEILRLRLVKASEDLGEQEVFSPYELFFESKFVNIPTAEQQYRLWDEFIANRSRGRPRDAIQMVNHLCDKAILNKSSRISAGDVASVMPIYSEERVDDLALECDLECPQIKDIIRAFHDADFDAGGFTMEPQTTADYLNELPSSFSITLFGRVVRRGVREDIFGLWRYLHEIGFLNARVSDSRMKDGFRHITAEEDPRLVSLSRWNEMQSILWEVNPAYRDYLIKLQKEKEFGFGQPRKKKKKRK